MKIGVVLGGGEAAVRAAHSLAADPVSTSVVVVGPAKSQSFDVVDDPSGCDVLIGSGPDAPARAVRYGKPLVWDGLRPRKGVSVWGASAVGLAAAMARREKKSLLAGAAHPAFDQGRGRSVRFARPVGAVQTDEMSLGDTVVYTGKSYNEFAACLVESKKRRLAVVDSADFLSGVALAAGVSALGEGTGPVWDSALAYLEMTTGMGLVMAEA